MATPKVFISYSHEDEELKNRLLTHLRVLERSGAAELWDTSGLSPGDNWHKEIDEAIRQSDVAVLLVSPSFLASDYIITQELPALLDRHHKQGMAIVPIMAQPSLWSSIPAIAELQFVNDPAKPLSSMSAAERESAYASIAERITEIAEAVSQRSAARSVQPPADAPSGQKTTQSGTPAVPGKGHLFVSHSKEDGDFAELVKLKLEREGHKAWIDTDRLDPGLDWREEIDKAIKEAMAVIAIMSPDARRSEYVTYEWAFAWGCGRKVIPIMLRQTTLHPRLATLQYLDFTNRSARPWDRLLEALSKSGETPENKDER